MMVMVGTGTRRWTKRKTGSRADFVLHFFVGLVVQPWHLDLDLRPRIKAWMARCEDREAWNRALERGDSYDLNISGQR